MLMGDWLSPEVAVAERSLPFQRPLTPAWVRFFHHEVEVGLKSYEPFTSKPWFQRSVTVVVWRRCTVQLRGSSALAWARVVTTGANWFMWVS
jgi:hypothetical protein